MTCSRCGTEMPAVANFCSHCGRHLRTLDATGEWPARLDDEAGRTGGFGADFSATTALGPGALDTSAGLRGGDAETADSLDPRDLDTADSLKPDDLETAPSLDADALAPTLVLGADAQASGGIDADMTVVAPSRPTTPPPVLRSPRPAPRERRPPRPRGDGSNGPLAVGQTFGTRYHIIKVLGVGGMGAVYQGWDTELSESVAIKVIRPEAIEDPTAAQELEKRFKRELLLARQVTHRNVVRIHDLGEVDGIKYITMTYVDGTDLATWLKGGPLDIPRTLKITRSIVEGLQAAHAAGIVHRDLKPANIMIRGDGEALIMDFGIARSTNAPADVAATPVVDLPVSLRSTATMYTEATMSGSIVGTVPYMAPEQARGQDVDQRTDIYALGLIVYDMLAGRHRASRSESAIQELKDRMEKAPEPINAVVPSVPGPLNELVSKCIEPDPANRFATTKELSDALARLDDHGELRPVQRQVGLPILAAVVTLMVALTAGIWWYQRQFIPPAAHDPVSVVIADLQNNTGDAAFDRTLEPMMKRALEGAAFVTAYDRSAIRGLGAKPREQMDESAAHELAVQQGLGVVLAGSIDSAGSGYRIVLKASQAIAGTQIFAGEARAASKDKVLDVTTRLVGRAQRTRRRYV
ncbi:MAG: serine/threonine-protein kinase [Vicinamibacterales bacterium]